MMAMIGFIMICAQGFAEVMKATGQINALVNGAVGLLVITKCLRQYRCFWLVWW